MFLDDDYPDYFLDDDPEPGSAASEERKESGASPRPAESARPDRPVRPGETISFAENIPPRRSDTSAEADRHDDGRLLTGRGRRSLGCGCLMVIAIASVIAYFRYLSPCVDDAVMEVCVTHIEKRGVFFKTYEAEIVVPESSGAARRVDTPYTRPSAVTVSDPAVAERLSALQASGKPVRLRYRRYYGTLPWRGESKTVVTGFAD